MRENSSALGPPEGSDSLADSGLERCCERESPAYFADFLSQPILNSTAILRANGPPTQAPISPLPRNVFRDASS
jgi:hypothetical protein